ncbi:MAG: phosphoribosylformylglycinamidine synthase subunit PurQ [Candidatus Neomarinimicrobiota bacterium]
MRFAILVFPGSNCDHDAYHAVRTVLGEEGTYVWYGERSLKGFDAAIIPGGFSYGDYLRSGAIARFAPIMAAVERFAEDGGLVLGICNGFQILVEAGLLPGALIRNRDLRFVSRMVHLKPEINRNRFTAGLDENRTYRMPVAHHGGNYIVGTKELAGLEKRGQIAFRYATPQGEVAAAANPNGSTANIAGVLNRRKNVLGLMPHPERAVEPLLGSGDGLAFFQSLVAAA